MIIVTDIISIIDGNSLIIDFDCLNLSIKIDTHIQILVIVVDFHRFLSIINWQILKEGTFIFTVYIINVVLMDGVVKGYHE